MVRRFFRSLRLKTTIALMMSVGIAHGLSITTYPKGLLNSSSHSKFTNQSRTGASIQGTSPVHMQANFGSVLLDGRDWTFGHNPIYSSDLSITDSQDFSERDILTVTGTYKQQEYELEFIKHFRNKHERLRIISVNPIIPEPSQYAGIAGFVIGAATVFFRRRR